MKTDIRDSKIHGQGCFAIKRIKKDEIIGEMELMFANGDHIHNIWIDDEEYRAWGDLAYANHSSNPNARIFITSSIYETCWTGYSRIAEDMIVLLKANRDIEPGEEITWHYGEDWDE